jgi:hypothetical protein
MYRPIGKDKASLGLPVNIFYPLSFLPGIATSGDELPEKFSLHVMLLPITASPPIMIFLHNSLVFLLAGQSSFR